MFLVKVGEEKLFSFLIVFQCKYGGGCLKDIPSDSPGLGGKNMENQQTYVHNGNCRVSHM